MEEMNNRVSIQENMISEIRLFLSLLPPPVSLDILCTITRHPPVKVLQIVEDLVQSGVLLRYREKGAGYYFLSDFKTGREELKNCPPSQLKQMGQQAITGVCEHLPDSPRRWLNLAHIYQLSGLPLGHFREMVRAGHHCLAQNLPMDAAEYYRLAMEGAPQDNLSPTAQKDFIDAAIGLCTCRDTSLAKDIQRNYLLKGLGFSGQVNDPIRKVKLKILLAKTYIKTIRSDRASKYLEEAWEMLSRHDFPIEVRIQVALANSEQLFWQGYITKAIERYESVIGSHEELPGDVETLKSCIRLGWTYGNAGETARGIGLVRAVRRKARELGAQDLERYATLSLVIILAEARRIEEGEKFLEEIFQTPEELLDHYTLWPGNGKRAYFACCRGEYEKAFTYLCRAWDNSQSLGTPHHRGPDNLEVMLAVEERGMVHPHWNFEADIRRLLNWPDIYMQGVAYRFRALKAHKAKGNIQEIKADLKRAIGLLSQAGAKIELSHAQVLLARIRISEKKVGPAERLLKAAWEVFSKVNPDLFPEDLKPYLDRASKNALWVQSLLKIGNALSANRTRDELLGKIIKQAMRIAGAERGAIFLRQHRELNMAVSRNLAPSEISRNNFSKQMDLIHSVMESGIEVVLKPERGDDLEGEGWKGGFPIRLKARVMGVLFMDRGPTRLRLPDDEISLLKIICNQAAVALENMEAYEEVMDQNNELAAETHFYRETLEPNPLKTQMIGRSEPFKKMLGLVSRVADSDTTVMITGETGVGKDMVAQAIHQHSNRSSGPFIAVNLVSLSPELIASELFGHEKGAFTGASQTRKGRFELASRGTLFLDDIDAFSLDIQVKMLRVLETKAFERVGGSQTLNTKFRLVAASNRNIEDLVAQGLFRSDFYYRLNVFPIKIPALRERVEDIPALAKYFMEMFGKKFDKRFDGIPKRDLDLMMNYHWPGNIRELRHIMERAVLLSRNGSFRLPPLDTAPVMAISDPGRILPLKEMEAGHILKALTRCRGKVSGRGGAAELLQVKPTTLYSKMKRLDIRRDAWRVIPEKT